MTGLQACRNIWESARLHGSLLSDIKDIYSAVRKFEDKSIVTAVAHGRASSARELLEKWY